MLTLREIKEQRRQHLHEFFLWRFGVSSYVAPLSYCSGLSAASIIAFRAGRGGWDALQVIEDAALHLGFRPPRVLLKAGKFTKPKSPKLPRWSDAAVRVRFYQWRTQTSHGQFRTEAERKKARRQSPPKSDYACSRFPTPTAPESIAIPYSNPINSAQSPEPSTVLPPTCTEAPA